MIRSEELRSFKNKDILQDKSEMQEKQEISRRQNEKMAALGQLAGGIAHDFNNQLMSIIGNATMIQRTDDMEKIKEYAERIIHISQSTANLTKKILMFSKKESSTNKSMNLKTVMDNTFTMMESILNKKIEIRYKYGASSKTILGDEAQIENLLVNLILNSKDSLRDSVGKIEIGTVETVVFSEVVLSHGEILKPGQYITIYVEDNGIGIADDVLMKIFEPYFSTKTKSKGTGLGLSVVFGTVKSHSGFINVISSIGSGTRFEVFIPVYTKKQSVKESKKIDIKSNLVMLVDDDENVLNVESELIEDLGYDVVKFSNPVEALEYYNKENNGIAFSVIDLSMPVMTGKQLYDKMKKNKNNTRAFFITGFARQADYEELIKNGEMIIHKPFTYEELSLQIAKIYK